MIVWWDRVLYGHFVKSVLECVPHVDPRLAEQIDPSVSLFLEEEETRIAMSRAIEPPEGYGIRKGLGGELDRYQVAAVAYAERTGNRWLCGDDTGLGKTVESLAWAHQTDAFPLLVVCPAFLKENWRRHVATWLPGQSVSVIHGKNSGPLPRAEVVIVNYDILAWWRADILELSWKGLVADECHYATNPKARRTEALAYLARRIPAVALLSATPFLNRPIEMYSLLNMLRPDHFCDVHGFGVKYCDGKKLRFGSKSFWSYDGCTRAEELARIVRTHLMIRREKKDVLGQLAPMRRALVPLDLDDKGRALYESAAEEVERIIGENPDAEKARGLIETTVMKRLAGAAKIDAVVSWARSFLDSSKDSSLVIFGHHREVLHALALELGASLITGETGRRDRQRIVDDFQEGRTRVLVASMKAAGLGIDLHRAQDCAFVELGWNAADIYQAESRLHRRGQEGSVTSWYLVAGDTIEEEIAELILSKVESFDRIVRGETGADSGFDVFREFLGRRTE